MAEDPFEPPDVTERPSGRPRRAKKTLADGFLEAIRADFRAHGAGVIAEVRTEKPDQYLKIVLSVLPKDLPRDLLVNINSLDALSDDEIRQRIRGLEAVLRPFLQEKPGLEKPGRGEEGISEPAEGVGPAAPH
ncbi:MULTISPECIES: hypothetical protein [unclassified Mesorhizobium]|uniref:hypothetical protein n=1 Tax=unclassified Mesorhizobium TaxID=325217 RepID=UPI001FDF7162|nr:MULTISPECIES: hypothetical protein [unclassified Mesorhizobium]